MSMSRVSATLAVLLGLLGCVSQALAQHEIHHVPPVIHPRGDNPDYLHPFIDHQTFEPDYQWFAPADVDPFGGGPKPNTGWFATYDRVRFYTTRPRYIQSHTEGDFSWGNRFDVGYMTDEDHGWLFSFWHLDGPNATDVLTQERINIFEEDDEVNGFTPVIILRDGTEVDAPEGLEVIRGVPVSDRNLRATGARDYQLKNSLNVGELTSMELNKSLRVKPLHYGSIFEPFIGIRYAKFQDYVWRETYDRYIETTGVRLNWPPPPPLLVDLDDSTIEQFTSTGANWTNHMVGGQLGFRWFKQKSHWLLSGEVRAFAFQNFQSYHRTTAVETTYYDGTAAGDEVIYVLQSRPDVFDGHAAEFVYGGEVRVDAAYQVTRDFSVRAGIMFMEFGRGIARGPFFAQNSEDMTMVGYTFGATLNR
jgi:hypothetical protein